MFTNPNTIWIEVLVIIAIVAFIGTLIGIHMYKKAHGLPTGQCAYCHKGTKILVDEYHKCYCKK